MNRMVLSRRAFLASAVRARPRVACVLNTWFPNSHADVFISRLLDGYRLNFTSHARNRQDEGFDALVARVQRDRESNSA